MDTVLKFLKDSEVFYFATVEGDQPRVRPFGAVCKYEGKLYFSTTNQKPTFEQIKQNPKIEISACIKDQWIRLVGEAVIDTNREAKTIFLKEYPILSTMYNVDDNLFEVFYLKNATATICSLSGESKTLQL